MISPSPLNQVGISLLSIGMQAGIPFIIASQDGTRSTSTKSSGTPIFSSQDEFVGPIPSFYSSLSSWTIPYNISLIWTYDEFYLPYI